jgi:transposase-like protein
MQDGNSWVYGDDGEETPEWCPACGASEPTFLGTLGKLLHFRCRCCGINYSNEVE